MNNKKTLHRLFEFAESCRGLLVSSVVFAVIGAGCGIIPYIAVSRIIIQICAFCNCVFQLFQLYGLTGQPLTY